MSDTPTIHCLQCKTEVTLKDDPKHTEYVPSATCPKCGLFYYVSWNREGELQVNSARIQAGE